MLIAMKVIYPVNLKKEKDGSYLVSFPDVPEAVTDGDTKAESFSLASDCLIAALGGYVNDRHDIPKPSRPKRGQPIVV